MNIERLTTLQPVWDRYDTQIHNQKDNDNEVPVHQVSYTNLAEMVGEMNKLALRRKNMNTSFKRLMWMN